jgi:hypothetical protein
MTSHEVTIAGYLVVLAAIVVLQVLATRTRAPIPSLGEMLTRAMRSRTGRVGVLVAWAWIGLHFFAKLPMGPCTALWGPFAWLPAGFPGHRQGALRYLWSPLARASSAGRCWAATSSGMIEMTSSRPFL